MGLFEFTAGNIVVSKDLQQLGPFNKVMGSKDWEKKIAYIFHMGDYSSPYSQLDDQQREKKLIDSLFDGKKPDKDTLEAVKLYKELSITESMELLISARKAVKKLRDYFENADPDSEDDPGKAAKDLMNNLNNVGKIIENIKNWEETIAKEKKADQTRKGVKQTKYNT